MRHNHVLAAIAAIVIGIAGLAHAQEDYYGASGKPAMHEHAGKTGKLKLRAAVKLGDVVLQPGDYEVRHINSAKGHFVEFAQVVENDYVPEGLSVYERQVVARVNCTLEPLNAVVAQTELLPKTDGTMARLEIRGEKVMHMF